MTDLSKACAEDDYNIKQVVWNTYIHVQKMIRILHFTIWRLSADDFLK
jgi:hypothetical protein